MVQPCPADVGMSVDQVETPALIVDLEAYEANLDRMARMAAAAGIALRPHAKTHKSPQVALDQIARGAVGVCCQKVSEAEILLAGGVRDIMVSNQIVGASKLARLAAMAGRARVTVCVDDQGNVGDLSAAATAAGVELQVMVEIDVGSGRCGVDPGAAAVVLAQAVDAAPGLAFKGLQAYHGSAQHIAGYAARGTALHESDGKIQVTLEALTAAGLSCPLVSGGGTGSLEHDLERSLLGELQAGSYVFMDVDYGRIETSAGDAGPGFRHSLFVLTTVMSTARPGQAVVDAGLKALAFDSGPPLVWERPDLSYLKAADEHGRLRLEAGEAPPLGTRLRLVPGHCDPTVNLYDWIVGLRDERVERVWPVAARGALS